jgi:hypothetical protein
MPIQQRTRNQEDGRINISVRTIILIAVSFFLGIVATVIILNVYKQEKIYLSTLELLTVGLTFSSIAMSLLAIFLSKKSEDLQYKIYSDTSSMLAKIRTSANVTEKRVEDVMRAERISDEVFGKGDKKLYSKRTKDFLTERLTKSLEGELSENENLEVTHYRDFQKRTLDLVSSLPEVKTVKKGDGTFGSKGKDLVDGIFELNKKKFSVSTFVPTGGIFDEEFKEYLADIGIAIKGNFFDFSILIFSSELDEGNIFTRIYEEVKQIVKKDVVDKIFLVSGGPEEVEKQLVKILKAQKR